MRRRLSHHRQPDPAKRPGAGVRRCRSLPTYNIRAGSDRGGGRTATPARSCSPTPWAIPSTSTRCMARAPEARSVAGRGLLRRAGRDLSTAQVVGTFGDIGTLSFYPAHHITMGEGGAVFTNNGRLQARSSNRSATGAAIASARRARTTPAASASAGSWATCPPATTTNTSTPTRLQPEDHGHAGGGRRWRKLDRLEGFIAARRQNLSPTLRLKRWDGISDPAGSDRRAATRPGSASPMTRTSRRAILARCAGAASERDQNSNALSFRWQSGSPALHGRLEVSGVWRNAERGSGDDLDLLDRRISGARQGGTGLCMRIISEFCRRARAG